MTDDMPRSRPPYIRREKTRHGRMIWAFRRGREYRRLPDEYGSPQFWDEYNEALASKPKPEARKNASGTLEWLVRRYKTSAHYLNLKPSTRTARDYIMKKVCDQSGDKPYAAIAKKHIQAGIDRRAKTPQAANNFLVAMSVLFNWAVESEYIAVNPCEGVTPLKIRSDGHHTWTMDEIEKFRVKWPLGTKPRLALDFLLYSGLRVSDAIIAGRQHMREGLLVMRTVKTNSEVFIPILAPLQQSIDACKADNMNIITGERGQPFASSNTFSAWFRLKREAVGLPDVCTPHGLRKAGATIAANDGASARELMSLFGWSRISMAETYTKSADRAKLAKAAAERIANNAGPYLLRGGPHPKVSD